MKAPRFWYDHQSALATLLTPLGRLYALATQLRVRRPPRWRAPVPVICVGNLSAGGTGKTPVVAALAQMLHEQKIQAHVVTRGYGGDQAGPVLVVPKWHKASQVGDEPLVLSRLAPVWVARDRVAGARAAVEAGAQVLLLDDGFQDPSLAKDLSLLVVDGAVGFGNGRAIPAGPLRESIKRGVRRAHAMVLLGADVTGLEQRVRGLPVLKARLLPVEPPDLKGQAVYGFAGIGRPGKFRETLEQLGARVAGFRAFPDHHPYTAEDQRALREAARVAKAKLITTAKDAVRLPPNFAQTVDVRAAFYDPSALARLLEPVLARVRLR